MKPTFYLNASALNLKSTCRRRLFNTILMGYHRPLNRNDVHFGTAWHKFRELRAKLKGDVVTPMNEAMNLYESKTVTADKPYITSDFLMGSILQFTSRYRDWDNVEGFSYLRDSSDTPLVEQQFAIPVVDNEFFTLVICGTLDAIGIIGDTVVILDDKTTSFWKPDEYFQKYTVSPQMLLYTWALKRLQELFPNSPVSLALAQKPFFAISIFGVFHSKSGVEFQRSPLIQFSPHQLTEFSRALDESIATVEDLCFDYVRGNLNPVKDGFVNGTCKLYGASACEYLHCCTAPTAQDESVLLENSFDRKAYNPLDRDE